MSTKLIKKSIVDTMVKLSKLKVDAGEGTYFARQFNETLKIVSKLNKLNTNKVSGTNHVTGLVNVFREDKIEKERVFSQEEALSNAKNTHDGYFLVKAIFNER